jgi:hypothetical protein
MWFFFEWKTLKCFHFHRFYKMIFFEKRYDESEIWSEDSHKLLVHTYIECYTNLLTICPVSSCQTASVDSRSYQTLRLTVFICISIKLDSLFHHQMYNKTHICFFSEKINAACVWFKFLMDVNRAEKYRKNITEKQSHEI